MIRFAQMSMGMGLAGLIALAAGCDDASSDDDAGSGSDSGVMTTDAGVADAGAMDAGAVDAGAVDAGAMDAGAADGGADAGEDAAAGSDAGPDHACLVAFFAGAAGNHTATATSVSRAADTYFTEGESYPLVVDETAWTITFEATLMGDLVYDFRSPDLLSPPRCRGDDTGRLVNALESGAFAINVNHAAGTGEWRALNPTVGGGSPPGYAEFDVTTP